jgi:pimeloyl-ACP methyl ester carboxylesterase
MALRLISAGDGEARDLVLVYHVHTNGDAKLREAAPHAIILSDTRPPGSYNPIPLLSWDALKAYALRVSGATSIARFIVGGWSEGSSLGPRAHLRRGDPVAAIVMADGAHTTWPPDTKLYAEQIKPWALFAAKAKHGEAVMIASHTMLTYVEKLPSPYVSSWRALKSATGFPLDKQGPTEAPVASREGSLVVLSFSGADAPAHVDQQFVALPNMLAMALGLMGSGSPKFIAATGGWFRPLLVVAAGAIVVAALAWGDDS